MLQINSPIKTVFESIDIPLLQVLRRMGYPPGVSIEASGMDKLVHEMADLARTLFEFKTSHILLRIVRNEEGSVTFENASYILKSVKVARLLRRSEYAVFFAATIGPRLEETVRDLQERGEVTQAFILDSIGSETADAIADRLHHGLLAGQASENGLGITPRFSPGYGDWHLENQKDLLPLCGGESIGIALNASFLMSPRKSVSAVLGWQYPEKNSS